MTSATLLTRPLENIAAETSTDYDAQGCGSGGQTPASQQAVPAAWNSSFGSPQAMAELERLSRDWSNHIPERRLYQELYRPSPSVEAPPAIAESALASATQPSSSNVQSASVDPLTSSVSGAEQYANPQLVPKTNMNVYPKAPISIDFQRRFPILVELFKRAVDNDPLLKCRTKDVNYELRLCGKCPSDAWPTILVFCTKDIFGNLRSLLERDSIRCQYGQKFPRLLSPLVRKFQRETGHATSVLTFRLVFWVTKTSPTKRKAAVEPVEAKVHSPMTMCGSLIRVSQNTSTLAIIISVDSKLYGLTVDHVRGVTNTHEDTMGSFLGKDNFDQRLADEAGGQLSASFELPFGEDPDSPITEDLWFDDVEYEYSDDEDSSSCDSSFPNNGETQDLEAAEFEQPSRSLQIWEGLGHLVPVASNNDPSRPYLDWALIELAEGDFQKPNMLHTQGASKLCKVLSSPVINLQATHTPIIMISGASGIRKGTLLPGVCYVGGLPGQDLCEVLAVDFSDSSVIVQGDCGSVVVHETTMKVYGHVVASNPLGQAYIVPIQNTLNQIAEDFEAQDVSLPDSMYSLAELIVTYKDTEHTLNPNKSNADDARVVLINTMQSGIIDPLPAFWTAASRGAFHVMEVLIDAWYKAGFEKLPARPREKTPLEVAAHFGQDHVVRLLLDRGGEATNAAAILAAEEGHIAALRVLLLRMDETSEEQDTNTLASISDFATDLESQGKYPEAEELLKHVRSKVKQGLGLNNPFALAAHNSLGQVLEKRGKYALAETIHRDVVRRRTRHLGEAHPDTLSSKNNLARVLEKGGKYREAEKENRQVHKERRRVLGSQHRDTMISLSNLAEVLDKCGKYQEAESLNREVLAQRKAELGEDHADTLTSLNNLAQVLMSLGHSFEAEKLAHQAMEGFEKTLGKGHPFTMTSTGNYAKVLKSIGLFEKAEDLYRGVLVERKAILGETHPSTLTSANDLSLILERRGKYEEATELNRWALKGYEETLGSSHPFTLTSVHCLASVLRQRGLDAEAVVYYRRAYEGYKVVFGNTHPTTLECRERLDSLLQGGLSSLLQETAQLPTSPSASDPHRSSSNPLSLPGRRFLDETPVRAAEGIFRLESLGTEMVSERVFSFIGSPYGSTM